MRSTRLLIILFTAIIVVVGAVFVRTVTGEPDHHETSSASEGSTADNRTTAPPSNPSTTNPPTIDLFGNRLEVPALEAGVALTQDRSVRPDPSRPDYLSTPPAGLRWQRGWGGAALPVSVSDGPTRIRDGIAEGFARTPQGAALAAADSLARALAAPDGIWQQAVRERYYDRESELLARFARSRERTRDAARYVVVPDGVRVRPGYRDDFALVEFAVRDDAGYRIATWPMAWIDGDWRVRTPDDIETLWGPGSYAATLEGFGSWRTAP